jgi:hypothetical protein
MVRATTLLVTALCATSVFAIDAHTTLLAHAWPRQESPRLSELGSGVGIVFSPDLSVPYNCRFYEALGFACFDDADWSRVLDGIDRYNLVHQERPIRTLLLETHGTNGNGLKLQRSYDARAERSYIAVGALQERVEPAGVRYVIISACNSGRLLRPVIYTALDPDPGDKLFLPATCGILNATSEFEPSRAQVVVLTPVSSHIETSLIGSVRELAPSTRRLLAASAKRRGIKTPKDFAISDMLIQILLRDQRLQLTTGMHAEELSGVMQPGSVSETLFDSFVAWLNSVSAAEQPATRTASRRW